MNLEYLARVVFTTEGATPVAYPDTLVGTDSHTTMINGLGVLGWGVGGIEAEAAMLGQPMSMLIPQVVGFKLSGQLPEGATATDLVLTVTEMLRRKGVVGKFVEFFGPGVANLPIADRATIANMAPEYGATCGIFPVDAETLRYLTFSGRPAWRVQLVEAYMKEQGLFHTAQSPEPIFSDALSLDLSTVEPSVAGPKRPQDRVRLRDTRSTFLAALPELTPAGSTIAPPAAVRDHFEAEGGHPFGQAPAGGRRGPAAPLPHRAETERRRLSDAPRIGRHRGDHLVHQYLQSVGHGRGGAARPEGRGERPHQPAVGEDFAGARFKVVSDYLTHAGLMTPLEALGFHLVGYGCTTCIGNSGPLPEPVSAAIKDGGLVVASVLSGNRNFEGRVQQEVRANYLMSPPLVVAFALAGRIDVDLQNEPLGKGKNGEDVFLRGRVADGEGSRRLRPHVGPARDVRQGVRRGVQGRRAVERPESAGGRPLRLGSAEHLHQARSLFRGHAEEARSGAGHRRCAGTGMAGRQHHHRPYLAGGLDQEGLTGGQVADRARRRAARLQLLRRAPRSG